jgi:hypothetical protein
LIHEELPYQPRFSKMITLVYLTNLLNKVQAGVDEDALLDMRDSVTIKINEGIIKDEKRKLDPSYKPDTPKPDTPKVKKKAAKRVKKAKEPVEKKKKKAYKIRKSDLQKLWESSQKVGLISKSELFHTDYYSLYLPCEIRLLLASFNDSDDEAKLLLAEWVKVTIVGFRKVHSWGRGAADIKSNHYDLWAKATEIGLVRESMPFNKHFTKAVNTHALFSYINLFSSAEDDDMKDMLVDSLSFKYNEFVKSTKSKSEMDEEATLEYFRTTENLPKKIRENYMDEFEVFLGKWDMHNLMVTIDFLPKKDRGKRLQSFVEIFYTYLKDHTDGKEDDPDVRFTLEELEEFDIFEVEDSEPIFNEVNEVDEMDDEVVEEEKA